MRNDHPPRAHVPVVRPSSDAIKRRLALFQGGRFTADLANQKDGVLLVLIGIVVGVVEEVFDKTDAGRLARSAIAGTAEPSATCLN
jgi:hypothetical protein